MRKKNEKEEQEQVEKIIEGFGTLKRCESPKTFSNVEKLT